MTPEQLAEYRPLAQTDLEHLITQAAAVAATHRDWWRLRQLFLATFMAERMTVEYPELATQSPWKGERPWGN